MATAAKYPEISVSQFRTRCVAVIGEVAATGVPVVVTRRGEPVAKLVPLETQTPPTLLGSVHYASEEDLLTPVDDAWEADR